MDKKQLEPLAQILIDAYLETASYRRQFLDDHGAAPTLFSKVHHLRSLVQARIVQDDRYELADKFAEFGRVEVRDIAQNKCYLMRSDGTINVERSKRAQRDALFDSSEYLTSDTTMLVYKFHRDGLDLSVAGTETRTGQNRVEVSGAPTYIHTWPYIADGVDTFDQRIEDVFDDLGEIDLGEDSEGE